MKIEYCWIVAFFVGLGVGLILPWWAILLLIAVGAAVLFWLHRKV